MKKLHVKDNIITFVDSDDQKRDKSPADDIELVKRLVENPQVPEELRALSRLVLLLATQNTR